MDLSLPETLSVAIRQTVAYADVFEYPVTLAEIHRYLIGFDTPKDVVRRVLLDDLVGNRLLETQDGLFFLPGQSQLVDARQHRNGRARRLWKQAVRYGHWITHVPFVRMVAVTGALANDNIEEQADLDYLVVTEPNYLWLCRAMILLLVRLTSPFGAKICPNYLITTNVMRLDDRNLFAAQELARMVPISGRDVYERFRAMNDWSHGYLPNAASAPREDALYEPIIKPIQVIGEPLLGGRLGQWLECWEMKRKIDKLSKQGEGLKEVLFTADQCKGHFDQHASYILNAFANKISDLAL